MKAPFDISADLDTPVSAFLKLAPLQPSFLLESVEGGERLARYSFLGFGGGPVVRLDADGVSIDGRPLDPARDRQSFLNAMRRACESAPALSPVVPGLPFLGGLVGATSYDTVRRFERVPARTAARPDEPEGLWIGPRSLLVFDHLTRRAALLHSGSEAERLRLREGVIASLRGPVRPAPPRATIAPARPSLAREDFLSRVARVQEHILAGDVFQLVLAIRYEGETSVDPFEAYRALRLINPSSYMYFLDIGGTQIVGSSPEALVRLQGRTATLRPIAGTRPRGDSENQDAVNQAELLADPKEAAEHVMLVDLARNDLGRVAKPGTVRVDPSRVIERYSHVMHLVSGVTGRLEESADAFDLFAATFPAGTVVGAPKVRAMEIIDELEPVRRGFYAGTVGYFSRPGAGGMDQAIAIRTLVFRGGAYAYQAGAGIVAESRPDKEHEEVRAKVGALEAALRLAADGL
ncbi:MAG: anthranilate synthase component I family protein [Phycisphaerae bacterium]|nr:anthranilate synthase component I family protein [Phycisphaerae bacterium]